MSEDMTKEQLAERLNGREYGSEISDEEAREARAAGLIVVFGASDDLTEFRGAIDDEAGAYDGADHILVDGKVFTEPDCECEWAKAASTAAKERGRKIEALWCAEEGYSWTFKTDIPHASFDVMEDGETYCRGIVFAIREARS